MPTITANGVEIAYAEQGSGVPALFIHGGFGGPQSTLLQNAPAITRFAPDGVRLITYDRRCAGASEYVLDEYTLEDIAADARALLDGLGVERSIIVGSSMGGMVALQYALAYPEHTSALSLLNTGPDLMSETPWGKQFTEVVEQARAGGDRALFEGRSDVLREPPEPLVRDRPSPLAERAREQRALVTEQLATLSEDELFTYSTGAIRNYGAFIGYDFTPRLGELRMPVQIVHGDDDGTVPFAYSETMRDAISQAEFHPIAGADHGITEYPEAQEVVAAWLVRMAGELAA